MSSHPTMLWDCRWCSCHVFSHLISAQTHLEIMLGPPTGKQAEDKAAGGNDGAQEAAATHIAAL